MLQEDRHNNQLCRNRSQADDSGWLEIDVIGKVKAKKEQRNKDHPIDFPF